MATGPSLTAADAEAARGKARVFVVNDAWRLAPWADLLYAADAAWWKFHRGVPDFPGEKWTQDQNGGHECGRRWGLNVIRLAKGAAISFDPSFIYHGWNSGFQALNLAIIRGARRILLLGFDMQRTGDRSHFFGDHPGPLNRASPLDVFAKAFADVAPILAARGIEVVNCSRETALTCFPRASIEEALCRSPSSAMAHR